MLLRENALMLHRCPQLFPGSLDSAPIEKVRNRFRWRSARDDRRKRLVFSTTLFVYSHSETRSQARALS